MTTTRKQHSPQFKARVVIEAIRGQRTLSQLGSQFKVHPIQIAKWRKAALEQMPDLFVDGRTRKSRDGEADSNALYEEIGRLKVELDWLKKKVGMLDYRSCVRWSNGAIRTSVFGGNVSCWASTAQACITNQWAKARRTCCRCDCWMNKTNGPRSPDRKRVV